MNPWANVAIDQQIVRYYTPVMTQHVSLQPCLLYQCDPPSSWSHHSRRSLSVQPRMGQRILNSNHRGYSRHPSHRQPLERTYKRQRDAAQNCSQEFEFLNSNENLNKPSLSNLYLQKNEEKEITNKMIQREIYGSRESGIFSEYSNQEDCSPCVGRSRFDRHEDKRKSKRKLTKISKRSHSQPELNSIKLEDRKSSKTGPLWQQRDKVFSRWNERYVILNNKSLLSFQKQSTASKDLIEIPLSTISSVSLVDRKGQQTLVVNSNHEGTFYLRSSTGVLEWYNLLKENRKKFVNDCNNPKLDNGGKTDIDQSSTILKLRDLEASGKFSNGKSREERTINRKKKEANEKPKEKVLINNYYFA
eukprot:GFUD01005910.1.p1 GENE.GFUD01005910.1~~GFUD01005910.1.p1  ORF type:complete len:360 (+),score=95.04 GFUD01005910.1:122-1201(+)